MSCCVQLAWVFKLKWPFCLCLRIAESRITTMPANRPQFVSAFKSKTLAYCVTDQPSITQYWRSVLNFKFSVLTCSRLKWALSQNCEKWIFQLQSMLNAIRCIDHRFAIKEFQYFVSGLDNQLEQSLNNNPGCRGFWFRNTSHILSFCSADTNLWLSG